MLILYQKNVSVDKSDTQSVYFILLKANIEFVAIILSELNR